MGSDEYDLCIIGGGINGVGIARDAALQGLSVCLLEQYELAAGTSSKSTKIIHGGLRYLKNIGEWGMVRDALIERGRLLKAAPDLIRPMEFILPHDEHLQPVWKIRLGMFLYDHLCLPFARRVQGSRKVDLKDGPLHEKYKTGFSYYDGWTNDAALVRANAADARANGADIFEHQAVLKMQEENGGWRIETQDKTIKARMAVNATGPWVRQFADKCDLLEPDLPEMRLVKGSHIIVPRQYDGDHAYILQQHDENERIIFAIPYNDDQTLIGTTEEAYDGDPIDAEISDEEISYLCDAYNSSFKKQISPDGIVGTYSGVRPLVSDGSESATETSRGFEIYRHQKTAAPIWSLYGGKLTTYRKVAEDMTRLICAENNRTYKPKTRTRPLPEEFHL